MCEYNCETCFDEGYITVNDDPSGQWTHTETCWDCGGYDDFDEPDFDYPPYDDEGPMTMWDLDPRLEGPDY